MARMTSSQPDLVAGIALVSGYQGYPVNIFGRRERIHDSELPGLPCAGNCDCSVGRDELPRRDPVHSRFGRTPSDSPGGSRRGGGDRSGDVSGKGVAVVNAIANPRRIALDRRFYALACVAVFAAVFAGFVRTYYLKFLSNHRLAFYTSSR
jgi:hypothetical protein